jgi:hypothetical protein
MSKKNALSETQLQAALTDQEQTKVELVAAQAAGAQLRGEVDEYKTALGASTTELEASKHTIAFNETELKKVHFSSPPLSHPQLPPLHAPLLDADLLPHFPTLAGR